MSDKGCVSLAFKGLPGGTDGGFHTSEIAKKCKNTFNKFLTSRWPGAKLAPYHQLAKNGLLEVVGPF